MTKTPTDPLARRRQRRRDEFERTCHELWRRGYSWRYASEATGATPDECRHAALRLERRRADVS